MDDKNAVGWFEIYVDDMDRARRFYEAVFAIEMESLPAPGVEMRGFRWRPERPGAAGALIKMAGCPPGRGGTLVYFSCADCSVEASRAAAHGGSVAKEKFSIGPHGFIALINDTEGNLVGLHSLQ